MSSSKSHKHEKRRKHRHDNDDDDDDGHKSKKPSLVDYSKVTDRHIDDSRYEKHRSAAATTGEAGKPIIGATVANAPGASAPAVQPTAPVKMSSQMQAVVRLMSGQEERTIAQKLADSNRPTWEQYKKDNGDKLNLEGVDQKKMEEYRAQLDQERETRLARGTNHRSNDTTVKKKESKDSKKKKKKDKDKDKKRKHKKHSSNKKRHSGSSSEDSEDDDQSSSSNSSYSSRDGGDDDDDHRRRRRRHRKKNKKKKDKKSSKGGSNGDNGEDSDGSHYKLSKFFTEDGGSGDD